MRQQATIPGYQDKVDSFLFMQEMIQFSALEKEGIFQSQKKPI
jgi:hypothetical protein